MWGKLIPARRSIELDALPIGLAKDVEVVNAIPAGQIVRTGDVVLNQPEEVLELPQRDDVVGGRLGSIAPQWSRKLGSPVWRRSRSSRRRGFRRLGGQRHVLWLELDLAEIAHLRPGRSDHHYGDQG